MNGKTDTILFQPLFKKFKHFNPLGKNNNLATWIGREDIFKHSHRFINFGRYANF